MVNILNLTLKNDYIYELFLTLKTVYKLILLIHLLFFGVNAQNLRFKYIGNEDGLSSIFVSSILQDDLGFMWFGTQDGLNKYDGYQFKVYKHDPTNETSLSCSQISCLKQISNNLIVVGTREGLNFFNPITEKFSSLAKIKGLNVKINSIEKFSETEILVGSDVGLFKVNILTKNVTQVPFKIENNEVAVNAILKLNNVAIIGTEDNGLWELKGNQVTRITFAIPDYINTSQNAINKITSIKEYAGKIYVGTFGNGLFKINWKDYEIDALFTFENAQANEKEKLKFIKNINLKDNNLLLATNYGLIDLDLLTEKYTNIKKTEMPYSLNCELINFVYRDNNENIWVGTEIGGINVAFSQTLKFKISENEFETSIKNIYSFYELQSKKTLIGGVKILKSINNNEVYNYNVKGYPTPLCFYQTNSDIVYLGTWGNGLIKYNLNTQQGETIIDEKIGAGTLLCLREYKGFLFACSIGDGLFRIDLKDGSVKSFGKKDGLPSASFSSIHIDHKNRAWIGTLDDGLIVLKELPINDNKIQIIKSFNNNISPKIAANMVPSVNQDKNNNYWITTSAGLSKIDANWNVTNYYEKDGLPNSFLYSILKDSSDNFWMSSNNGLIKFNPLEKELNFRSYTAKDGLVNTEFNMGAALFSKQGVMYFGGANGYNSFRPSKIKDNRNAPKTYIVNYKRTGKDVLTDSLISYKKYIELSWKENYFQFELAALDYTDPSKNKFKYLLEGYDEDWSSPSNVRYISYTELPGGTYKLKIKACNNDGVWNETPYEITIRVIPPFWKTTWFYVLLVLFGGTAVFFLIQYRTNAIKKENKILENKVSERTKELAEKNQDILSSIEYAKRIQEAILPSKEYIFQKLKKAFILYQPKDIVSGDFYWFAEKNNWKIFACVDCTGHGVPGAFMSMIGHNLLHQIVSERAVTDPSEILNQLHRGVQEALRQGHNEVNTNDGMDVSLMALNNTTNQILWAGANRPLILINANKELIKYEGNKFPVGGAQLDTERKFTTQEIVIQGNCMAYMFTDGYADQFGGEKGKKFMVKRFYELLLEIYTLDVEKQKDRLLVNFDSWKTNHEQVDDVLVIGIEI